MRESHSDPTNMISCRVILSTLAMWLSLVAMWNGQDSVFAAQKRKTKLAVANVNKDKPFVQDGLTFLPVPINAKEMPACVCWAPDGSAFYCLDATEARLCKFSVNPLEEVADLEIGARVTWVSLYKEGVVVTLGDQTEIWLVDPETLEVKRKADVPSASKVYSSPSLMVGFAVLHGQGRDGLGMVDLRSGKLLRIFTAQEFRTPKGLSPSWGQIAVAPDGKVVWVVTGGHLQRFKFTPSTKQLQYDDSSPASIGREGREIVLSPDGSLICWPCGAGNDRGLPKHPEIPPYATYIYETKDISQPKLVLRTGAYPQAVGLDPVSGLAFGQNFDTTLLIYNLSGLPLKSISLRGHGTYQFAPSPVGGKLLMLTSEKLLLVDTSPLAQPRAAAPAKGQIIPKK